MTHVAIVIIVGIFATTLAQPLVLARLPLQNLLKNELHVSRTANAAFFFWCGLPWYFKPLAGILTDAFPVFGSRRRSYILIATGLACLAWIGVMFTPHIYESLLGVCIVISLFMSIVSAVVGGYMVEAAQATAGSGRLTAMREFVQQTSIFIRGPAAGYLASIAFGWTAAACGGVMFLLVPATILFLHEQRKSVPTRELLDNATRQLGKIASAHTMWAAAGLMALFYIAPGVTTAVFYKQQNELHMTTQAQGDLAVIAGAFGLAAAFVYSRACRRINLRKLLIICLFAATAANASYLFYNSVMDARIVEGINGFGFTLAELALMDLAVRATPAGSEGLGFSLMMSVRNLALFGTDWLGSAMIDKYHVHFDTLVLSNCATTLITVPLVLLLPRLLVQAKDDEPPEEVAVPAAMVQT
jgi:hypothetical protein